MARLPVPGGDTGQWGDILNEYLATSHASDGSLKSGSVVAALPDSSIPASKLQQAYIQASEKAQPDGVATLGSDGLVPTAQLPASAAPPDASTIATGMIQLSGDLGGTATSPTVPGLAAKAAAAITISAGAGLMGGGDLTSSRTLAVSFGTAVGTVAAGNDARITGAEQAVNKGVVNGYASLDGSGKVPSVQLPVATDATTTSKGVIQLAGDLGGTASVPTVPGLGSKAAVTTTISAGSGLVGGGDLSANRTLAVTFGTAAGTVAQGNDSRIAGAEQVSNKGVASGYASLDGGGKVPVGQLPAVVQTHIFSSTGSITVTTGTHRLYNNRSTAWVVNGVRASVGTAPTGASLIVDIKVNGVTLFTTQANRPTVAVGTLTSGYVTNMDVTSVAPGAYMTVDVAQVGSAVPGSDLTVQIEVV
jgi:hypothetical protein